MARQTILTAAITGNLMTPEISPNLPVTPVQIAQQALDAAAAGAAIVHLHVRDPITSKGSMRLDLYEELVGLIRAKNTDVLINLTTGEGGRFVPSDDDPKIVATGSTLCAPEKRVAHVQALRPDICTLDFNTMWSGQASVINSPRNLKIMAQKSMRRAFNQRSKFSTAAICTWSKISSRAASSKRRSWCKWYLACALAQSRTLQPWPTLLANCPREQNGLRLELAAQRFQCCRKRGYLADMCALGWRTRPTFAKASTACPTQNWLQKQRA